MPEAPEIKCSTDFLDERYISAAVTDCSLGLSSRYKTRAPAGYEQFKQLVDEKTARIVDIDCKGKLQWFEFFCYPDAVSASVFMHVTHGMTGFWSTKPVDKHLVLELKLDDDSLFFGDIRHFATLKFVFSQEEHRKKLASLGHDMLSAPCTLEQFQALLGRRASKTLPEFLMSQRDVSGVGNYVKAEALYRAGLSPHRTCGSLSHSDAERLFEAVKDVLTTSYKLRGATIRDYRDVEGNLGQFSSFFQVYKRSQDHLSNEIVSEDTKDKRTTWWCPTVQR